MPHFFDTIRYADLLVPTFTIPPGYTVVPGDAGVVPLGSVRVIRSTGAASTSDPAWKQACPRAGFNDSQTVYADTALQALFTEAQQEDCVPDDLRICVPPVRPASIYSFGVPLPEGYLSSSDLAQGSEKVLTLAFSVVAYNPTTGEKTTTALSMSIELSPLAYSTMCVTLTASQDMRDIVKANVVIGTASNAAEWALLKKKEDYDSVGYSSDQKPSQHFELKSTTVQGAIMTFAALGDPEYFEDERAKTYELHMHDLFTVHFLEPFSLPDPDNGYLNQASPMPRYDSVIAMLMAGTAFDIHDDAEGNAWLVPSPALLALCPYTPYFGHMECVTRKERTITDGQNSNHMTTKEVTPDNTGKTHVQDIIASVQGGGDETTQTLYEGEKFHEQLMLQWNINTGNNRYRKAYMVNPIYEWSQTAMQVTQRGSNPQTVLTKIMALGLITVTSPQGTQRFRRLLSVTPLRSEPNHEVGRHLLSLPSGVSSSAVTKTQAPQSQVVSLAEVPGYDGTSVLCRVIMRGTYEQCKLEQYQLTVPRAAADHLCNAQADNTLASMIQSELTHKLIPVARGMSAAALVSYTLTGCDTVGGGGRRLLSQQNVILSHRILGLYDNATGVVSLENLMVYLGVQTPDVWATALAGGAYVQYFRLEVNETDYKLNITFNNVTNTSILHTNLTAITATLQDTMFTRALVTRTSAASHVVVPLLNMFALAALSGVALL